MGRALGNKITHETVRWLGPHAGCPKGGSVHYTQASFWGSRHCDKCGQSSHGWWTDATTGERRPPLAPETVAEMARRSAP
jgi:hypothetical protein